MGRAIMKTDQEKIDEWVGVGAADVLVVTADLRTKSVKLWTMSTGEKSFADLALALGCAARAIEIGLDQIINSLTDPDLQKSMRELFDHARNAEGVVADGFVGHPQEGGTP